MKTILLVEDEALIAMNEQLMLESHDFSVISVHRAGDAIEAVNENVIDLILMDIDLGKDEMDGTDVARIILDEHDLPIVFLTGHAEKKYVNRVKKLTGYGYVLKNSGEFVLLESINMAFELFEAHYNLKKRNKFIETILDNLPIGLAVNNIEEGYANYMNKQFENIYGWPKEDLKDVERFFQYVYPDPVYRKKIKTQVYADINFGDPNRMNWDDIEITTKNGTKKRIFAKNIPLTEQNVMVSTVQDVTDQKRMEEALRESQQLLDEAHRLAHIGVWTWEMATDTVKWTE